MYTKKRLLLIPAALLLAGASGVGFAHAASGPTPTSVTTSAHAAVGVAQGDATDAAEPADAPEANASETAGGTEATAPDGDNVQQGDQTAADNVQQGDQTGSDTGN